MSAEPQTFFDASDAHQPDDREAPVGVALIGCGYWGRNYARVLTELSGVGHVTACDKSRDLLADIKSRFGDSVICNEDLDVVLEDHRVDAVVIATPPSTHAAIVSKCLAAGKHVLVEKPFTIDEASAEELIDQVAEEEVESESRVVLMVGHTFLFNSSVHKLKEILHSDAFGTPYYFHATRTNLGPVRSDVNVVWDLAAHDISVFLYLLDSRPCKVSATGHSVLGSASKQCDVAFITLYFPDNRVAHIHVSWCEPSKVRRIVAVGSKSRVEFNDMNKTESIRIYNASVTVEQKGDLVKQANTYAEQVTITDGDVLIPHVKPNEPLKAQVQHFLDCIKDHTVEQVSSGTMGRDVVKVLCAVDESIANQGQSVDIEW